MKWIGYLFSSIWRLWFLISFIIAFIVFIPALFLFTAIVKNNLIDKIKNNCGKYFKFETTDDYGVDGDFVESQAFAFLAIRSFFELPISFPNTTGCKLPSTGGVLVKNF